MAWIYEGEEILNAANAAVAGRLPEDLGFEPCSLEEVRRSCYDIHDRVKDMDANGELGALCFPTFVRFAGQILSKTKDPDQAAVMVRAYNDWHLEEWAGTYPGRIIPLALPMLWDAEAAADEVRRVAKHGCHAIAYTSNPYALGYPSIHTEYWDPLWAACVDEGTVVCMHLGSHSPDFSTSPEAPIEVMHSITNISLYETAADWLFSSVFRRFPDLRISLTEGGIGWIPYMLERVDRLYTYTKRWSGTDLGGKLPSEIFHEHVLCCYVDDAFGIENLHHLNLDNVSWECDFPHATTTWPNAPEEAMQYLDVLPDDEIDKITHLNAMRHYQYDPFTHIPREDATVGALRKRAEGWDVSPKPMPHVREAWLAAREKSHRLGGVTIGTALGRA
jgi:predicted TIM-barrel fold metal-dependent hydrolase